jgi:hypothetical protein
MKYWYDCEFLEDGRTIDLISIGIVAEDDRELYLVNEKAGRGKLYNRIRQHPWLMSNVVPHLPLAGKANSPLVIAFMEVAGAFTLDPDSLAVVSLDHIRKAVRDFIQPKRIWDDDPEHPVEIKPVELWAWCGAYDHVVLMQLFGPMIKKPEWFPSYTHDFQHLLDERRIRDYQLPTQVEGQHNALADAKHLRFMMQHLDGAGRRVSVPPE